MKITVIVIVNKKRSLTNEELVKAARAIHSVQYSISCIHDIKNQQRTISCPAFLSLAFSCPAFSVPFIILLRVQGELVHCNTAC